MENIDSLLMGDPNDWIRKGLEPYQQKLCAELLAENPDPMRAAEAWLTASTADTFPFGTIKEKGLLLEEVIKEIEKFLCGDPSYEKDRKKIIYKLKSGHAYFISSISVALAPNIGSSAVVVAPVVALIMLTIGKCSLAVWCKRKSVNEQKMPESDLQA